MIQYAQRERTLAFAMSAAGVVAVLALSCGRADGQDKAPPKPPVDAAPAVSAVTGLLQPPAPSAGVIFGQPVSMDNYYFAKRVAYMFPRPWGAADLPADKREDIVWESLILHYESFKRGITAAEEQVNAMADEILRSQDLKFTRRGDPDAYRRWATDTLREDVVLFENQLRYLIQIRQMRDRILEEQRVDVTLQDMQQEFINEQHHVGGEMVVFEAKDDAQRFYEQLKESGAWDIMKDKGLHTVRPVSMMTIEAYVDLWSVPHAQMMEFHALPIGTVGPPMPFGTQWAVYRLLDKRTGDLKDFPGKEEAYRKQMEMKKKAAAAQESIAKLKQAANLKVYVTPETGLTKSE